MTTVGSIIVPLKRQVDAWLHQCVKSALEQSVPCEVIVVRSRETPLSNIRVLDRLAESRANLRVLVEEKADNFPAALNLGIAAAESARVGLLLSDDWLDTNTVLRCMPLDADVVCTGQTTYAEDGTTVVEAASQTLRMAEFELLPSLEAKASYLEHFFLFRRETLIAAGGLDESIGNYAGVDDYDLIWTLLERGVSVAIVEERLYNYRDHGGERLTLADPAEVVRTLENICRKHHVPESEVSLLVGRHARWCGKTIQQVLREDGRL